MLGFISQNGLKQTTFLIIPKCLRTVMKSPKSQKTGTSRKPLCSHMLGMGKYSFKALMYKLNSCKAVL